MTKAEIARKYYNEDAMYLTDLIDMLDEYEKQAEIITKEKAQESIENALYSTGSFSASSCTNLAEGIILFLDDINIKLSKK